MKKLSVKKVSKPIYNDWWNGKTFLNTCSIRYSSTDNIGIATDLTDYDLNDQKRIKEAQKKIFQNESQRMLMSFRKEFEERYQDSEVKDFYLENEILDLKRLFNGEPENLLSFRNRDYTISKEDLLKMRRFIETYVVRGDKNLSFVHSPHYKFPNTEYQSPYIFIYANWKYFEWLNKFNKDKQIDVIKTGKNTKVVKDQEVKEERRPVPVIALCCFYKGMKLTKEDADKIARDENYKNKNSGLGLFHDFTWFSSRQNRLSIDDGRYKDVKRKLRYIEAASKLLKGKARKSALNDFNELNKKIEDQNA
jgi:hypothetical protein